MAASQAQLDALKDQVDMLDTTIGALSLRMDQLKTSAESAITQMDSNNSSQNATLGEALNKLNVKGEEFEDKTKVVVAQLNLNLNELVKKAAEEFKIQEAKLENVVAVAMQEFGSTREKIEDLHKKCEISVNDLYDKFGTVASAEAAVLQIQEDLKTLYKTCEVSCLSLQERVAVIEASGGDGRIGGSGSGGRGGRDYIPLKNQMPDTFDNELKVWRNWRTDLLSYVDTVTPGMKRFMIEVESMNASPSREWLQEFAKREGMPFVVEDQVKIWRVLKKTTKGEARKIVESIRDEDGYMAWREIVNNFEPAMASRQGTSLAELMAMVSLKASSPEETKMMLNELERRRKEAEDFSEAKIPDATLKGVLISFMDQRTNDHSTDKHSQGIPYVDLNNHVLKFINNTKTSSTSRGVAPMQLGIIKEGEQTQDQAPEGFGTENYPQYYPEGGGDDGYLWALKGGKGKGTDTRTCWLCNETGHIGRNCPSKGKGKGAGGKAPYQPVASKGAGKGYGQAKGQSGGYKGGGKGGGPKGRCGKCKGPHYADQCPMNQGNGQMRALGEVEGPTCQRLTVLCEVEKVADQKIVTTRLTKDKD